MEETIRSGDLTEVRQLEYCLHTARSLMNDGKDKESLHCLFVGLEQCKDPWGFSMLVSEIAEMARKYPPAREALMDRRLAVEQQILDGQISHALAHEWTTLSGYLDPSERKNQLLSLLDKEGARSDEIRDEMARYTFEDNLRQKNYRAIYECFDYLGRLFFYSVGAYEARVHFPSAKISDDRTRQILLEDRLSIRKRGAQLYEVALGVEDLHTAELILNKVLSIDPSAHTYTKFVLAAIRAGKAAYGSHLLRRGDNGFSQYRIRKISLLVERQLSAQFPASDGKP